MAVVLLDQVEVHPGIGIDERHQDGHKEQGRDISDGAKPDGAWTGLIAAETDRLIGSDDDRLSQREQQFSGYSALRWKPERKPLRESGARAPCLPCASDGGCGLTALWAWQSSPSSKIPPSG